MSVLSVNNPTLADLSAALDPNGGVAQVVEILSRVNPMLDDMTWIEGNLPTGHQTTVRTGLPSPTWRKLYGGVQPTKSTRAKVIDTCGMLEAYAEVDKALADLNGNSRLFRLSEDKAHIEAMSQALASALFYSSEVTNPEQITGLSPRYSSLSAENADNIIDAGGVGDDNTSIWLVVWGQETCHGIYPKGSKAGLQTADKGLVTLENVDGQGGRMEAYRTHYRWDCGLSLRDWRYVVRIANIDVSDLDDVANSKKLVTWMIDASERIPNLGVGRACWYMNRSVHNKLRIGIHEKLVNTLTWENVGGKRVMVFDDIPVRRTDSLQNNEARVV